jgi:N-terminal half of MaoC dehydratase
VTGDPLAPIEARLRGRIGEATTEHLGVLRRHDFLRFAVATGDTDYLERMHALPPGASAPAPALYVSGVLHWTPGPVEVELRPDGLTARDAPGVEGEAVNVMHGGQAITFHRQVCEGAAVRARRQLRRAERKAGRSAEFLLVVTTTQYHDGDDALLVTVDDTILVVPR